jgi:hypothetical protein
VAHTATRVARPVVGFCEFGAASNDLRELRRASDRCASEAARILRRHHATFELRLYDRAVLLFDPVEGNEAAAAALELCTAIAAAVGLADADETPLPWGRAHLVARALASAALTGEVLVDDLLRRRLGPPVECEPVELPTVGLRAWRLLSGS